MDDGIIICTPENAIWRSLNLDHERTVAVLTISEKRKIEKISGR